MVWRVALTDAVRCANAMADLLAKQAAESIAIPPALRDELKQRFTQARELAMFVGRLTFAAGHCDCGDGHFRRDSVGMCAGSARHRVGPVTQRVEATTDVGAASGATPQTLEERSLKIASVLQRIRSKWAAPSC